MDVKVLRNFVEIVDSGSLTAASKKLFIAQSALSNQLKVLERELGVSLLWRNSHRQQLTDAGRLFYNRAKQIVFMENAMINEVSDAKDGEIGCLKIATIQSGEVTLLQSVLPRFAEAYPGVTYEITEGESDQILQKLQDGAVGVAVVTTPCHLTEDMNVYCMPDERLVLAYDPDRFFLDDPRREITIADLKQTPVLIIRRYEEMFRALCDEARFQPNIRVINKQLTINLKWCEAGLGVAIVPENSLAFAKKTLAYKTIVANQFAVGRAIVTMKNGFTSAVVKRFLQICQEQLQSK